MYKCEKLTIKKLEPLRRLNATRTMFNTLNNDFFETYSSASFTERLFLRNQVRLLTYNNNNIGYIWLKKIKNRNFIINSFSLEEPEHHLPGGQLLLQSSKRNCKYEYECEKNDYNFDLLSKLGFIKGEGTMELFKQIDFEVPVNLNTDMSFESFQRGKHEKIRCRLQNEIFKNGSREPLTIEDIYFDVIQRYFWEEGSVFLKYQDKYIGYGQIILDSNIPTIVNFGIINEFRSKGLGIQLLARLINLLYSNGHSKVKLKVNSHNYRAYNLYIKLGFNKVREYYNWLLLS